MSARVVLAFIFISNIAFGQITPNPKVTKKSTNDTFINKIELTDSYTIVSMQYVSKTAEEQIKDYYNQRPDEKERMSKMNPMMRSLILQQYMEQLENGGSNTISIQPSCYLLSSNGERFKFLKATNIPVAPDRMNTKPGKKYFFKVYFEKLNKGIEKVDLIESEEKSSDYTYWNFYGVDVNNPKEGEKTLAKEENVELDGNLLLKGKILDFDSKEPLQGKIICKIGDSDLAYDSVRTSRTGYFEFLIPRKESTFFISAEGYDATEQNVDFAGHLENEREYNFYLEKPYLIEKPAEIVVKQLENESTEEEELEKISDSAFRLNKLYFELGKSQIMPSSYPELNKVIKYLNENKTVKIRVEGHTDNIGDSQKNLVLSIDRAKAVRDYIIAKGIDVERVSIKGYGDTRPLEAGQSTDKNRRVEIQILD